MFCFPFLGNAKILCKIYFFIKSNFLPMLVGVLNSLLPALLFQVVSITPGHWNRERWCYSQLLLILAVNTSHQLDFSCYNFVFLVCLWFVLKCYINNRYELLNWRCPYLQMSHTNPCTYSCFVVLHIAAICFEFNELACLHEDILISFLKKVLKIQTKRKAQMLFLGIIELQFLYSVSSNGCFYLL